MRTAFLLIPAFMLLPFCGKDTSNGFIPTQLKCNNLMNPVGTDSNPLFNWIVTSTRHGARQIAYQIILDTDPHNLKSPDKCLWNSGIINSSETSWIRYSGPELKPANKYFWRLRIWDENGNPSGWSKTTSFITGLFNDSRWNDAKWIGFENISDSLLLVPGVHGSGDDLGEIAKIRTVIPYFRKEFNIEKKLTRALVFISGLGQYELYINGEKTGDTFLSPGWTDYNKTCYYNSYDITEDLKPGNNCMGVITGNGFYNINRERYRKLVIAYGAPKMILKMILRYEDGSTKTITSDETWKTSESPLIFSSIYGGEDYDARLEQPGWADPGFDDSGWKYALHVKRPEGTLRPEKDYPLKIMQVFDPDKITSINDTLHVFDFGQNASGIIKMKVKGQPGQSVRIIPGELIDTLSLVSQKASGSPYWFNYVLRGGELEIWTPRFTYYGFRYVQVEGAVPAGKPNPGKLPVISELQFLHTRNSSPVVGKFKCSNILFNSIYELINWAIKSNLASVATDCPHREKLGWLEQTHLMGNSIKYIYDIHNLFDKIIDDMIEAQLDEGLVPDIAPEYVPFAGGFRDSPEWGSACIILPWYMYEWYGDLNAIKKAYPMMKKYLRYLENMSADNILSHGLGDWYDLGPEFPGEAQLTPQEVTATSIFYYDARLLAEMAGLIGKKEDEVIYKNLAEKIRAAFNKRFFDPESKVYSTGSQTAFAMPLFFGMVDEKYHKETVVNLVNSIVEDNMALTAGDIGYRYLLRVLEREGYSQIIYEMNSRNDVPGYGFQISRGATALTESWAALKEVSNNHMMLGHLMEWFYSGLAGIRQMPGSKAYEHVLIAPEIVGDLNWVDASCRTINGIISSSWKITNNNLIMKVSIPPNCRATIRIPQADPGKIILNEAPLESSDIIKITGKDNNMIYCECSSGNYLFKTKKVPKD